MSVQRGCPLRIVNGGRHVMELCLHDCTRLPRSRYCATAVDGALLAPDQLPPFHPAEMVGETAVFPADVHGHLGRTHPVALGLA